MSRVLPVPPALGPFTFEVREFESWAEAFCLTEVSSTIPACSTPNPKATSVALLTFLGMAVTLLRPQMLPDGIRKKGGWHLQAHNRVNLGILPVMSMLSLAGVLAIVPNLWVCCALAGYMCFDFLWISIFPRAVASKPKLILIHHCLSFFLASACAVSPSNQYMCSYATCVEFNTFFLVAMRLPSMRGRPIGKVLEVLFWVTCVVFRFIAHPWLVYHSSIAAPVEYPPVRALVVIFMVALCIFNVYYVYLRVKKDAEVETKRS